MNHRKTIIVGIAVVILLLAIILILNFNNSKAAFAIFKDHREWFEAVKNETQRLASDKRYTEDILLFENGGNVSHDRFHGDVDEHLQSQIKQLVSISNDQFTFLRYAKQDGEPLIRFVFNWERAYGRNTYHFIYCESEDAIRIAYNAENVSYELDKLGDAWYGMIIK